MSQMVGYSIEASSFSILLFLYISVSHYPSIVVRRIRVLISTNTRLAPPPTALMNHAVQRVGFPSDERRPLPFLPRIMTPHTDHRAREPMHHCRSQDYETDHGPHRLDGLFVHVVLGRMRVRYRRAVLQHRAGLDDEEQRADAHGAEVPAEERLAVRADVGDEAFQGEDDGDAAEEEDEGEQGDQPARRDGGGELRGAEEPPRDDGAEVDEHARVEEQVEDVGQVGFARLVGEPAVPGEAVAGAEGDEEVVHAEGGADADGEDGEEEVEDEEGGRADVVPALGEPEASVETVADDEPDQ